MKWLLLWRLCKAHVHCLDKNLEISAINPRVVQRNTRNASSIAILCYKSTSRLRRWWFSQCWILRGSKETYLMKLVSSFLKLQNKTNVNAPYGSMIKTKKEYIEIPHLGGWTVILFPAILGVTGNWLPVPSCRCFTGECVNSQGFSLTAILAQEHLPLWISPGFTGYHEI